MSDPGLLLISRPPTSSQHHHHQPRRPRPAEHLPPPRRGAKGGGGHRTGQLSRGTLTAGVLGTAIRLLKVVLCFAFYSPTESAFCWVGDRREQEKMMVMDQHEAQRGSIPEAAQRPGYLGSVLLAPGLGRAWGSMLGEPAPGPQTRRPSSSGSPELPDTLSGPQDTLLTVPRMGGSPGMGGRVGDKSESTHEIQPSEQMAWISHPWPLESHICDTE